MLNKNKHPNNKTVITDLDMDMDININMDINKQTSNQANQPNYKTNILLFVAELIESGLYSLAIKALLDEKLNICNEIPNILITLIKLNLFNSISKSCEEEEIFSSFDFLKEVYLQFNIDFTDSSKRISVIIGNPLFLQSNFYSNVKESSFQQSLLNDFTNYMLSNKDADGGMVDSMEKEILFYQAYYSKAIESVPLASNVFNLISNNLNMSNYEVNHYETHNEKEKNEYFSEVSNKKQSSFIEERRKSTGFDSKLSSNENLFIKNQVSIIKSNLIPMAKVINNSLLQTTKSKKEEGVKRSIPKEEVSSKIFHIEKVNDRKMETVISNNLNKLKHQIRFQKNLKNIKITKSKKGTKVSIMNELNFKRIKREKIDKIVMRRFFNFVQLNKKNSDYIHFFKSINSFSNQFANGMFKPPFVHNNIAYYSINTSYLIWLFSNEEICYLYNTYMELNLDYILSFIKSKSKFEWTEFEEEQMSFYLKNYHFIYSGNNFNN